MNQFAAKLARLSVIVIAAAPCAVVAANAPSPAEVSAQRQKILSDMLAPEYQPLMIANLRRACALGREPASVAESRAGGAYFTPDAADRCVVALVRTAHDGHLPDLYRSLLTELGGSADGYERLPTAIGASVLRRLYQSRHRQW